MQQLPSHPPIQPLSIGPIVLARLPTVLTRSVGNGEGGPRPAGRGSGGGALDFFRLVLLPRHGSSGHSARDRGDAIDEFRTEEHVGVVEHALFQRDHQELRLPYLGRVP